MTTKADPLDANKLTVNSHASMKPDTWLNPTESEDWPVFASVHQPPPHLGVLFP